MKRQLTKCLMLLAGLLVWLCARAGPIGEDVGDFITERAWLEDATGQLTPEQVLQRNFTPYSGVLSRGYSSSTHWVRLTLKATHDQKLILRIRPSLLDDIALYEQSDAQKPFTERFSGDRHPWGASGYPSLNLGFALQASEQPRTIYLRLRSKNALVMYCDAHTWEKAQRADRIQESIYSLYFALLSVLFVWALVRGFIRKESAMARFAVVQAVGIVQALSFLGYTRMFLADIWTPASLDSFTSLMNIVVVGTLYWFHLTFLREFKIRRRLWQLAWILLASYPGLLCVFALGNIGLALRLNALVGSILVTVIWVLAVSSQIPREESSESPSLPVPPLFVVSFYTVQEMFALMATLSSLGFLSQPEWMLNVNVLAGSITGVLMLAILIVRTDHQDRLRRTAQSNLKIAEAKASSELQRRQEQSHFLTMLGHELKTPLSVVRMVLSSPDANPLRTEALQSIQEMNDVIERCVQAGKLNDGSITLQPRWMNLEQEIRGLAAAQHWASRILWQIEPISSVQTDPQLLRICIANLLDNATKYSPPNSPLTLKLTLEAFEGRAGVAISVFNQPSNAGWPEPERVFERYYRSPGAHRVTGSGLGLHLVQGLMALLGGHVQYAPTSVQIIFVLWLPV